MHETQQSQATPVFNTPTPKPRKRKRRGCCFGCAGLALAFIIGMFLLPWLIPTDWLKEKLITEVERATGKTCTIEELRISLPFGLSVRNVRLENPGNTASPDLSINTAEIRINATALLSKKIQVEHITVSGMVCEMRRNTDGTLNWATATTPPLPIAQGTANKQRGILLSSAIVSTSSGNTAFTLGAQRIDLADIELRLHDQVHNQHATVHIPDLSVRAPDLNQTITFNGTLSPNAKTSGGTCALQGEALLFSNNAFSPQTGKVNCTLQDFRPETWLNLLLSKEKIRVENAALSGTLNCVYTNKTLTTETELQVANGAQLHLENDPPYRLPVLNIKQLALLKENGRTFEIPSLSLHGGGLHITASGKVNDTLVGGFAYEATGVCSELVPFLQLQPGLETLPNDLSGSLLASGMLQMDPDEMRLTGTLGQKDLRIAMPSAPEPLPATLTGAFDYALRRDQLKVDNIRLATKGSNQTINGNIEQLLGEEPQFHLTTSGSGDLQPWNALLPLPVVLSGETGWNGKLTGTVRTPAATLSVTSKKLRIQDKLLPSQVCGADTATVSLQMKQVAGAQPILDASLDAHLQNLFAQDAATSWLREARLDLSATAQLNTQTHSATLRKLQLSAASMGLSLRGQGGITELSKAFPQNAQWMPNSSLQAGIDFARFGSAAPWLGSLLPNAGTGQASLMLGGSVLSPGLDGWMTLRALQLPIADRNGKTILLPDAKITWKAAIDQLNAPRKLQLHTASLTLPGVNAVLQGGLQMQSAGSDWAFLPDTRAEAQLTLSSPWFRPLLPEGWQVNGKAILKQSVDGNLRTLKAHGNYAVEHLRILGPTFRNTPLYLPQGRVSYSAELHPTPDAQEDLIPVLRIQADSSIGKVSLAGRISRVHANPFGLLFGNNTALSLNANINGEALARVIPEALSGIPKELKLGMVAVQGEMPLRALNWAVWQKAAGTDPYLLLRHLQLTRAALGVDRIDYGPYPLRKLQAQANLANGILTLEQGRVHLWGDGDIGGSIDFRQPKPVSTIRVALREMDIGKMFNTLAGYGTISKGKLDCPDRTTQKHITVTWTGLTEKDLLGSLSCPQLDFHARDLQVTLEKADDKTIQSMLGSMRQASYLALLAPLGLNEQVETIWKPIRSLTIAEIKGKSRIENGWIHLSPMRIAAKELPVIEVEGKMHLDGRLDLQLLLLDGADTFLDPLAVLDTIAEKDRTKAYYQYLDAIRTASPKVLKEMIDKRQTAIILRGTLNKPDLKTGKLRDTYRDKLIEAVLKEAAVQKALGGIVEKALGDKLKDDQKNKLLEKGLDALGDLLKKKKK